MLFSYAVLNYQRVGVTETNFVSLAEVEKKGKEKRRKNRKVKFCGKRGKKKNYETNPEVGIKKKEISDRVDEKLN